MGREGIEPPQSKTADLQSAELTTCSTYPLSVSGDAAASWCTRHAMIRAGADDGTRTRNRRFTKPLLYQLSYVGARRTIPQVTLWRPGMIGRPRPTASTALGLAGQQIGRVVDRRPAAGPRPARSEPWRRELGRPRPRRLRASACAWAPRPRVLGGACGARRRSSPGGRPRFGGSAAWRSAAVRSCGCACRSTLAVAAVAEDFATPAARSAGAVLGALAALGAAEPVVVAFVRPRFDPTGPAEAGP